MSHYKITALEIGQVEAFPADFAFDGALYPGEVFHSTFLMFLVQGGGKNILVDCGFDPEDPIKQGMMEASFVLKGRSPREVLATVGLTPEDIDVIILSHVHWDHAGAVDCFPSAKMYLQENELKVWKDLTTRPGYQALYNGILDPADLDRLDKLVEQGRLTLLSGESDDLFPGIHIRVSEMAHSAALQVVLVDTDDKTFVLASDAFFRPENLLGTEEKPYFLPGKKFSIGGMTNTVEIYRRIMEWADGDVQRVISCHDGTASKRFPSEVSEFGLNIIHIHE